LVDTLLDFQDAVIGYEADIPLISDLNLRITRGSHVVITGSCGVGKSAIVKTILGLLNHWKGEYYAFGRDMGNPSAPLLSYVRKKIGILPDRGILLQHLTVFQNIALPLRYGHFVPLEKVTALLEPFLEEFHLEDLLDSYPSSLNLDQIKKVGFVRALINNPDLCILDDPFEGLDDEGIEAFWRRLTLIDSEKEITVLVFTRKSMNRKSYFNHRYHLMSDGLHEVS
jgi:phospholipid/cholesterol/gamma-HCH transport system ATP-binding protein